MTFNLWSSAERRESRADAAAEVLAGVGADLVALQEVSVAGASGLLDVMANAGYSSVLGAPDGDNGDRVAVLSRLPLSARATPQPSLAVSVTVDWGPVSLGFTSVHFPANNILASEQASVSLASWLDGMTGYEILAGDLNSTPTSSVGRFWLGEQSLSGHYQAGWNDPVERWSAGCGVSPPATLDFITNPRWAESPTLETPARFDRILVRDTWQHGLVSPVVAGADLIGTMPAGPEQVVPSDHYGVVVDLDFSDVSGGPTH